MDALVDDLRGGSAFLIFGVRLQNVVADSLLYAHVSIA
jgi:hypothetical protein